MSARQSKVADFWRRHWNGEYSLGRSYWWHFRFGQLALLPLIWLVTHGLESAPLRLSSAVALLLPLLLASITAWQVHGTWLAARRHVQVSKASSRVAQAALVLELFLVHLPGYATYLKEIGVLTR